MTYSTILITGGTGKFGRQYVHHFVRKGWLVVFTATSSERARDLELSTQGPGHSLGIECDLTRETSIDQVIEKLRAHNLEINHLVNNARNLSFLKIKEDGVTQRDDFINEYLINVVVPYELSLALWREQSEALRTIINISSQYGVVATNPTLYGDRHSHSPIQYGVSKAALNHLTHELAVRMAPYNIRVNAVAYGGVEGRTNNAFKQRYSQMVPNGRMLSESEIPGPVDFLTSEKSSAITGQVIAADGGWIIW